MVRFTWGLSLAAIWLLLTGGSPTSWLIGLPFIVLALVLLPHPSPAAASPAKISPAGLPGFLAHFVTDSVRGGVDVSRRVMSAKPVIDPGFFDYPIRLQSALARHLFVNSISLLPGTLCADWQEETAHIHSLDHGPESLKSIQALERSIGRLFGEQL